MASQIASTGPTPVSNPSQAALQTALDTSIWYLLSLWPALHVAVRDLWGGPSSADKRDWFAGAVSEFLTSQPSADHDDLVVLLLQVMQDEFDCNVEDDSEEEVAGGILAVRKRVLEEQDLSVVKELEARWRQRGQVKVQFQVIDNGPDEDDGEEWDGFDEEDEDGGVDVDVDMADAQDIVPDLVPALKEKQQPEVDEDGFTKVTKKKR